MPPFTRTKVNTGGQEVTSEDRDCDAESSGSSLHKDQGEYSTGGQEVTSEDRELEAESSGSSVHKDQGEYSRPGGSFEDKKDLVPLFARIKMRMIRRSRK